MLGVLSPDMQRDDWLRVGMALHAGGFPFEMWDAWSAPGRTYDARAIVHQWKSFKDAPAGVSMGSLVHMAKQAGWRAERAGGWAERSQRHANTSARA